jgi:hypothetical protein
LGDWLESDRNDGELVVEGDENRYDVHVHMKALHLLTRIRARFGVPRYVQRAFKRVDGTKRGYGRFVAYLVRATRASGDCRTSIENSILKGLMVLYSACRAWGFNCRVPHAGRECSTLPTVRYARDARVRAKIRGDDSVNKMGDWSAVQRDLFVPLARRLGFSLEPKFHTDLNFVTFCSGRYWPTSSRRVWGPMPGRAFCKMSVTLSNPRDTLAHIRGVAECYLQESSYVPFLRPWIDMLLRNTRGVRGDSARIWRYRAASSHEPSPELAAMVQAVYGLELGTSMAALTDLCDAVVALPCLVNDEVIATLVRIDMQ